MVEPFVRPAATCSEAPYTGHFTSVDLDHAQHLLNRFFYPVRLSGPAGADAFRLGLQVIQLGPLTVAQLNFDGPVTIETAELGAYHVTIPTAGRVHAWHAGHEVVATASQAAVFGPGGPVRTRHDANSAELDIKIERTALEEELAGLLGRPVDGPIDLPPLMDLTHGPGQSWSQLVRLLRDELDYPQSLIYQPLIAEQVRSSVLSGLLLSVPHRYHDELTGPAVAGPPRAIRRVVDAIHDEPEHAFTVGELARIAGMSVRSLQEGFRRHLDCPPMAYLQRVRLSHAQDMLRRADPARMTVAAVAHRCGFAHLGRFASSYRAQFGESPSETLRGD
jgi:AraC-like DNA-binding protein